tara:strand:- start:88 stop:189 length:102 start_codon:yes stop_codon:yes gene_type:complete
MRIEFYASGFPGGAGPKYDYQRDITHGNARFNW